MEWYTFLGMFCASAILVGGFWFNISKNFKEQSDKAAVQFEKTFEQRRKQTDAINIQTQETIKLSMTIKNMHDNMIKQDDRVTKHGREIDEHDKMLNKHEARIQVLESK